MDSRDDRTRITPLFWVAVGLAAVTAAASVFTARDLAYDGSHYLLGVAAHGSFVLFERARIASQILQQGFAVAGARAGIRDLWTLGVLFSLAASGWPVVLTALCWFVLPRGEKIWIAGPLFNLVFVIPTTNFIGIGEGIISSCLLWIAFLLVEFRSRSAAGACAGVLATAVCAFSHEAAMLCLLVIALTAALRISEAKGWPRAALFVAAAVALAGAANMARWILFPRSATERVDFLVSMLGGFLGTPSAPNIPTLMSLVAAAGCAAVVILGGRRARIVAGVTIAVLAILLAVLVADPARLVSPSRFFASRGLPVTLTTLLAGLLLLMRRTGQTPARFVAPPVLAIVLGLAVVQAGAQVAMTVQWTSYVRALRGLVSTETGIISHATAMQRLDPAGARFRRELLENWSVRRCRCCSRRRDTFGPLSKPGQRGWVPYDPAKPATLPDAPGLDYSGFVPRPAR